MSTYNENLQTTSAEILSQMQNEKQKLKSQYQAAEYGMYYAQGANIVANEVLEKVDKHYKFARKLDDQGVQNDNIASNVLASATQASTDVGASVNNTAVAASNVQIAANAITELAADMASAYSYVGAETHTNELFSLAETAYAQIQQTAYDAEEISEHAMKASARTSEIQASQLLDKIQASKSGIEGLLKATSGQFTSLAAKKTADTKNVDDTSKAEIASEGALLDTQRQIKAIEEALHKRKSQLNYHLEVEAKSLATLSIKCTGFKQPFPHVAKTQADTAGNSLTRKNDVRPQDPPDAKPTYYGILLPAKDAELFSLSKAEMLFGPQSIFNPDDTKEENKGRPFFKLDQSKINTPTKAGEHVQPTAQEFVISNKLEDANGNKFVYGQDYVFCLYICLDSEYKKFINDFHDMMSAPSELFTLASKLNIAEQIVLPEDQQGKAKKKASKKKPAANKQESQSDATTEPANRLSFIVPEDQSENNVQVPSTEYYCILLPKHAKTSTNFISQEPKTEPFKSLDTGKDKDPDSREDEFGDADIVQHESNGNKVNFFFDLDVAQHVSPGNMTLAKENHDTPIADMEKHIRTFDVSFDHTSTDNFGTLVSQDTEYVPVVLSINASGNPYPVYLNTMSKIKDAPTLKFDENFQLITVKDSTAGESDNDDS